MNQRHCYIFLVGIWACTAALGQDADQLASAQQAVRSAQVPAEVYNRGVRLYREGNIAEAATCFRQAASASDSALASKARYNLGNTHYARAIASLHSETQPDPEAAISELQSAIVSYRSALRINRDDLDARANIELASQLIQQIQEQQQQQQNQQQQPSEQQQDPSEKDQQQDSSQQNQQQQSDQQDPSDGDQRDASEPTRNEQNSDQQSQQQQESGESESEEESQDASQSESNEGDSESESESDASEPNQENDPSGSEQQPPDQRDTPPQNNRDSSRQSTQQTGDPEDETQDPREAAENEEEGSSRGELSAANEDQQEPQTSAHGAVQQEPAQLTEEEARKILQSIRDRDMIRRLRRQAARAKRRIPVERDW